MSCPKFQKVEVKHSRGPRKAPKFGSRHSEEKR